MTGVARGGTVNVQAATYNEHVSVAKDVTVQGSGLVKLQGTSGDGFAISAGNVMLKTMSISGFANGINVTVGELTALYNRIVGNTTGIAQSGS